MGLPLGAAGAKLPHLAGFWGVAMGCLGGVGGRDSCSPGPSTNVTFGTFSLLLRYAGQHLIRLYILFMRHGRFASNSFGGLIEKAACSDWLGSRISVLSHSPFAPDTHAPAAWLISGEKPRSWGGWLHVSPPLPLGPDLTEQCCKAWPRCSEQETGVREVAGGVGLLPARVPVHTPWPF